MTRRKYIGAWDDCREIQSDEVGHSWVGWGEAEQHTEEQQKTTQTPGTAAASEAASGDGVGDGVQRDSG